MKKKIVALSLVAGAVTQAMAAAWVKVGDADLDMETIRFRAGSIEVWVRVKLDEPFKVPGRGDIVTYVSLQRMNCAERTIAAGRFSGYSSDGEAIRSGDQSDKPWEEVVPDTRAALWFEFACMPGVVRPLDPHWEQIAANLWYDTESVRLRNNVVEILMRRNTDDEQVRAFDAPGAKSLTHLQLHSCRDRTWRSGAAHFYRNSDATDLITVRAHASQPSLDIKARTVAEAVHEKACPEYKRSADPSKSLSVELNVKPAV